MQIHPWPEDLKKAWKSTYHFVYGHCQSFDSQIQGITNISVTDKKGHPELQFKSIKHGLVDWYDMDMIIHNRDDFQDAHILHDKDKISSMTKDKIFKLSKKVVNSISTRRSHCQKYAKHTCILRHMNRFYHDKYQCQIVFVKDYIDIRGFLTVTEFNKNSSSEALEDALSRSGLRFLVRRCNRLPKWN